MTERQSAWSAVMIANWIAEAVCPSCPEANMKGKKHMIELTPHGEAFCNTCGASWSPPRYVAKAVNE